MDNNELRKYLKKVIADVCQCPVFYHTATDAGLMPYVTFDYIELLSEDVGKHIMELTVEAWDENKVFNIIEKTDALDKVFAKHKEMTEKFMIQIFLGSDRQFIEDEDKTIKRLQRKYDMVIYERRV